MRRYGLVSLTQHISFEILLFVSRDHSFILLTHIPLYEYVAV